MGKKSRVRRGVTLERQDFFDTGGRINERGERIDGKGRIVASLPPHQEAYNPNLADISVTEFLDRVDAIDQRHRDDEASIESLMQPGYTVSKGGGSRSCRSRRDPKPPTAEQLRRSRHIDDDAPRSGRPLLGLERRVKVETTIDPAVARLLADRGITVASILDEAAHG